MKIIALEAENVKHLRVVNIKPDGSLVVIGGNNSEGKSSVLDSIEYALNGAGAIPPKPIRDGQKKARVVLDLGDLQVTRTFTKKGTNLVVKNKDGATFPSPQAMLDKLVGELTFDPLEFSKMDAKKQAEVLKKLIGLDFDKMDAEYQGLFDQRTIINRQGKDLKGQLEGMTEHNGVPDTEESIQGLGEQYANALEHNRQIDLREHALQIEVAELNELRQRAAVLVKSIKQQQETLVEAKAIDAQAIQARIAKADSINIKIRENKIYAEVDQKLVGLRKQSKSLSDQMTKITDIKATTLAKAKFPIEGLAINDDGIIFENIPLVQCSTSDKLKISVAIGLAINPELCILLIREGSLLDEKNLAMIAKMAADAKAQVWLERVSKGSECSIIIQDGSIVEPEVVHA